MGRGPLAGPVVAAAVALDEKFFLNKNNLFRDSKTLSIKQKNIAFTNILTKSYIGIGISTSKEIDAKGISYCTKNAMYKAIQELEIIPDFVIIDAVKLESLKIPSISLIKGDQRCLSVAAASIVAKISRDRMMKDIYEVKFPNYGFASNKGYGSKQHLESLNIFGPSKIHRMSFKPLSAINMKVE